MDSMAKHIPDGIYEDILVRLDVRNLFRCMSVCKSWKSLISETQSFKAHFRWYIIFLRLGVRNLIRCKSVCRFWKSLISNSYFIKAHLKRSYNSNENGHKRIGEAVFLRPSDKYSMIGSSNGLVCIIYGRELLVANPLTREVKPVPRPFTHNPYRWGVLEFQYRAWGWGFGYDSLRDDNKVVCGFGYDSLRDDYKVVCGVPKGKGQTYFQVFSLKLNAWNVIGKVNNTYVQDSSAVGVLCNGAIHWVMHPKNQKTKKVILSFDLSKDEFKEIPQPNYARHKRLDSGSHSYISLGIMEECLCIQQAYDFRNVTNDPFLGIQKLWVMKKYNGIQSWGVVYNCKIKYEEPCFYSDNYFVVRNDTFTGDLFFNSNIVESLVSPHLQPDNEYVGSYCYRTLVSYNFFSCLSL